MTLVRQLIDLRMRTQLQANSRSLVAVSTMALGVAAARVGYDNLSHGSLLSVSWLLMLIFLGFLLYTCTLALLWRAAGRPEGPERVMIETARRLIIGITDGRSKWPRPK